jgi:hypothetical protein
MIWRGRSRRILTLISVLTAVTMPAAMCMSPVQAAPDSSWNCGSGMTAVIYNTYGEVASNISNGPDVFDAYLIAIPDGDSLCWAGSTEGTGWFDIVDTSISVDNGNAKLTWNSHQPDGPLYFTGQAYPASQAWSWNDTSNGYFELTNYYSGTCLAGEAVGDNLYMYTCLANGADSLDWNLGGT